jgi:hypothetical protein
MRNTETKGNNVDELLLKLAALPNVEKVSKFGNRIMVKFPRERGGSSIMTIPAAKTLLERLSK